MNAPLVVIPVGPHDEARLASLVSLLNLCEPPPAWAPVRLGPGEKDRGYPDGAWDLFLKAKQYAADSGARDVMILEPDGAPLVRDWYRRLCREHDLTLAEGKWITAGMADHPWPHVNGNLVMSTEVSMGIGRPPSGEAWDVYHAEKLLPHARITNAIYRRYRATWKAEDVRRAVASGGVWAHSSRDGSLHARVREMLAAFCEVNP